MHNEEFDCGVGMVRLPPPTATTPPLSPERYARYVRIQSILEGYRMGLLNMQTVLAIPESELQDMRNWLTERSFDHWEEE